MRGTIAKAAFGVAICAVAWLAGMLHASALLVFVLSALAIVVLATWIGQATEAASTALGPSVGALLGATFGNSVELIIAVFALREGLFTVVKASVMGSILANLLLTLGVCMIVGSLRSPVQQFSRKRAGVNSVMLFLAVIGLTITSVAAYLHHGHGARTESLSIGVAVIFLLVYLAGFVFSLFTHRAFLSERASDEQIDSHLSLRTAAVILAVATVLVAVISDQLVAAVQPVAQSVGLSEQFIGLIIIPLIGIAPEFFSAVLLARRDKLDGSVEIAIGSSLQIALFVAPALVLVGLMIGRPLTLVFSPIEVVVICLATVLVSLVSLDGETHWYEGVMVTATYAIVALLFFFD